MKKSIICLLILLSLLALIACAKNADGDSASMQSGSRSDSFVAGSSSNSENQNADINEEFEDYEKSAYTLDNAYAENASVDLITYAKGETSKDSRLILYVINTEAARVGTESDVSIISDFLDEGYVVTVADYKNDARAVSPELEWSTLSIKLAMASGSYYENVNFNPDKIYMVPSGCRIKTDITYFDYLESASVGTKEYCVKVWNGDLFRTKYGNKVPGGYFEATDFSQLINSDGSPVDTTLKMDIIYPSQPINKTPLFMLASSTGDPSKRNLSTMTADRPHYDGFLFRGYACACYDHEFIPFLKGYGYQDTYTLNNWNGVKTQTAAVRCARYYADSFGYDVDRIGVMGHSKSSYCLLLANPDPTSIKEKNSFSGFDPNETYGEQPYLTYKGTDEPIPSHANVVYASMGMGAKSYEYYNIGSDSAPVMIASGYYCQYNSWAYWSDLQQYYMEKDVTHLPISMWDLGHVYAYGTDTVYGYDRYQTVFDFFGYYLGMNGPSLAYTSAGKGIVAENDGLFLHFISDFEGVDIKKYIKVTDSEGNVLAGTLKMAAGGLRAVFEPQTAFEKGQSYVLYILDGLTDKNGAAIEPVRVEFEYGSVQQTTSLELSADADATLKANGGNQGGDKFVTIGTTGAYQSLLRFKIPTDYFYGYYSSAKLYLETQLSEKSALQPTEGTQIKVNLCSNDIETAQLWNENAVTWANTKSDGSIPIRGIYAKSGGSDAVKSYTCPAQMQRAGESNEYGRYIVSIDVGDLLKLYKFNKTEEGKDYIYCTFRVYTSSGSCVFYSKENTDDVSPAKLILEYYNYPENANVAVKDAHIASYNSTVKQSNYGGSTQIQVNIYRNAFLQFDVTDYLSAGGLDLRKLSLYLNTTESFEETDLSNLPIVIVKAKDNNGNNTYGWEEGVENGAVPSEGGGITWADGVSGILANRTTLSNVEFSGYTTLNDMHVLKIEFSASYLTDGEYLQTDPTSGRTYITIGIIGSGKSYSIKFLTKEGGVGMKSFAPFVVLSDLPTASDDASGSEAEGVSDVYSYPSHTETYTPSALYGDEIIQDKNTALDYVDFYEFVKPIRLIRLNTGEKHLSAGAGVSVLSDGCDSFKFKVTATDVSEISVNGGCDSAIMFCHNNPNYLLNYI